MEKDISLIPIDEELSGVLDLEPTAFESKYRSRPGSNIALMKVVIGQTLAMIKSVPRDTQWGGYFASDNETNSIVGTCGYRTGPRADGSIELAYFTFPEFERQGFATAMAMRLRDLAKASPDVRFVIAHTLPQFNPSTRVLQKIGMRLKGELVDPDDGAVWEWALPTQVTGTGEFAK